MAAPIPVLDADGVNALLQKAFPGAPPAAFPTVLEVSPGRVRVMAPYRDGLLREIVLSDVHSPSNFRVNGPLPNIDAWYAAFNVQPGDKLYIPPAQRVRIW